MASILTILFFLSHLIWANLNKHHYILINPQKSFYPFNGEFTVAHIGSKRLTHRLIVSWYRLKLAQSSQKSAGSSHCSHWKARRCEPRASKREVRRELGSLKNGQSRSSGKELSFISGEYAKSLKMMFALSHYTQFLTLQPVLWW